MYQHFLKRYCALHHNMFIFGDFQYTVMLVLRSLFNLALVQGIPLLFVVTFKFLYSVPLQIFYPTSIAHKYYYLYNKNENDYKKVFFKNSVGSEHHNFSELHQIIFFFNFYKMDKTQSAKFHHLEVKMTWVPNIQMTSIFGQDCKL